MVIQASVRWASLARGSSVLRRLGEVKVTLRNHCLRCAVRRRRHCISHANCLCYGHLDDQALDRGHDQVAGCSSEWLEVLTCLTSLTVQISPFVYVGEYALENACMSPNASGSSNRPVCSTHPNKLWEGCSFRTHSRTATRMASRQWFLKYVSSSTVN